MPDHRLPKRVLFGMLPPDVGTQRRPGLQAGKRLRDAFAKDLVAASMERQGGCNSANSPEGDARWRLSVQRLAVWYPPKSIQLDREPPTREPSSVKLTGRSRKRVSHQQRLNNAEKRIKEEFLPKCAFLRVEEGEGGREEFGRKLLAAVENVLRREEITDFEQLWRLGHGLRYGRGPGFTASLH